MPNALFWRSSQDLGLRNCAVTCLFFSRRVTALRTEAPKYSLYLRALHRFPPRLSGPSPSQWSMTLEASSLTRRWHL